MRHAVTFAVLAALAHSTPLEAQSDSTLAVLRRDVTRIAGEAGGRVGIAVRHVERGTGISVRGDQAFPLQSVYKVPIAMRALQLVAAGRLRLDDSVAFRREDVRLNYSPISERFPDGGTTLTVRELIAATIGSDGATSDRLMELGGGARAVTAMLRGMGFRGIRVDRSEAQLAWDYVGVRTPPGRAEWSMAALRRAADAVPALERSAAARRYLDDPRDTATPDDFARLFARLVRGELLDRERTALLLGMIDKRSPRGERFGGALPAGTRYLQKSGTSATTDGVTGARNAVGVITLPDGSHLAVAVLVSGTGRDDRTVDGAIARIVRRAYDAYAAAR